MFADNAKRNSETGSCRNQNSTSRRVTCSIWGRRGVTNEWEEQERNAAGQGVGIKQSGT